jgi:uncharacterized membrane protein (UPF0127 family)
MKKPRITLFNIAVAFLLIAILLFAGLLLFVNPGKHKPVKRPVSAEQSEPSPVFRKEGELSFIKTNGKKIATIDIEVADNEAERVQGLMYRDSMGERNGMIFLFPEEDTLSFWMKNTRIPLDIIYVNREKEIVHIARNTTPYSLAQIPSKQPAMYVVEVNAGFTERYLISVGDMIHF